MGSGDGRESQGCRERNRWLGGRQQAVEPAQRLERQDHVLVLATVAGVVDQIRNIPMKLAISL